MKLGGNLLGGGSLSDAARGVTVEPVRASEDMHRFIQTPRGNYAPKGYFLSERSAGTPLHKIVEGLAEYLSSVEIVEVLRSTDVPQAEAGEASRLLSDIVGEGLPNEFAEGAWNARAYRIRAMRALWQVANNNAEI